MSAAHLGLQGGRWFSLTLIEQMANIGSEVARALEWKRKGNAPYKEQALTRALELFDLTLDDSRWKGRLREIARAREVTCDYFYGGNQYSSTHEFLDRYFLQFAQAARKNK